MGYDGHDSFDALCNTENTPCNNVKPCWANLRRYVKQQRMHSLKMLMVWLSSRPAKSKTVLDSFQYNDMRLDGLRPDYAIRTPGWRAHASKQRIGSLGPAIGPLLLKRTPRPKWGL